MGIMKNDIIENLSKIGTDAKVSVALKNGRQKLMGLETILAGKTIEKLSSTSQHNLTRGVLLSDRLTQSIVENKNDIQGFLDGSSDDIGESQNDLNVQLSALQDQLALETKATNKKQIEKNIEEIKSKIKNNG